LDADLLDGQHASAFAPSSHSHSYLPLSGGSLTGDLHSNYFRLLRAGKSNTTQFTFNAVYQGGQTDDYTPSYAGSTAAGMTVVKMPSGGHGGLDFLVKKHGTTAGAHNLSTFTKVLAIGDDGSLKKGSDIIWHAGNDGSGSGLDADLLDGQHASAFAANSHSHNYVATGARLTGNASNITTTSVRLWDVSTASDDPTGAIDGLLTTGMWDSTAHGTQQYHDLHTNTLSIRRKHSNVWHSWDKVWTSGNDGAGSGLDADTVDGYDWGSEAKLVRGNGFATQAGDGQGIGFWGSGTGGSYRIYMSSTSNGTYGGRVNGETTSDYNMYFRMEAGVNRGFVFRNGANNVATVTSAGDFINEGNLNTAGHISQGLTIVRPKAQWSNSGTSTGAVVINFPGDSSDYGMVHVVIDIYEYNSTNATTITVGGHNWNGSWHNYGSTRTGKNTKAVRVGYGGGKYFIRIGDTNSSWSYGNVVVRSVNNGTYYQNNMDIDGDWSVTKHTAWSPSWESGSLVDKIWGSYNDGSGSGLDADLLDGNHASAFALAHSHPYAASSHSHNHIGADSTSSVPGSSLQYLNTQGNTTDSPTTDWYNTIRMGHGNPNTYYNSTIAVKMTGGGVGEMQVRSRQNGTLTAWRKQWDSSNDGSGSGLDADTLAGTPGSSFLHKTAGNQTLGGGHGTARLQIRRDSDTSNQGERAYLSMWASEPGVTNDGAGIGGNIANGGFYYGVENTANNGALIRWHDGNTEFKYLPAVAGAGNAGTRTFYIDTSGNATASGNLTAYSDERLKSNIETITSPLNKVKALRGVTFDKDGERGLGVIAQETEAVIPEVVMTSNDEMGTKSVAYGNMVGLLIEAIKEQQTQIDELKLKLEELT